jgi:DUF971 family protein
LLADGANEKAIYCEPARQGADYKISEAREGIQMHPSEVALIENQTVLAITWQDGEVSRLDADVLRRASRAASEIRRQAEDLELNLQVGLRVDAVEPVGAYALRLFFSDGHDRGIYPWAYLRDLSVVQAA